MPEKDPTRRRPSLALVVSLVAVVLAMSGTAYAVTKAPKNSVVSSSIKNGQVRTADLGKGTVTPKKIKPGAVGSKQIRDDSVLASHLGSIDFATEISDPVGDADGTTNGGNHGTTTVTASCPEGGIVIGGGAFWIGGSNTEPQTENLSIHSSHRISDVAYRATGIVDIGAQGTVRLRVDAYCLLDKVEPK